MQAHAIMHLHDAAAVVAQFPLHKFIATLHHASWDSGPCAAYPERTIMICGTSKYGLPQQSRISTFLAAFGLSPYAHIVTSIQFQDMLFTAIGRLIVLERFLVPLLPLLRWQLAHFH